MPRDLDFYMSNPDEFAGLSEEDRARLYAGGSLEGDTAPKPADDTPPAGNGEESSEAPAADTTPAAETAEAATEATEPVILTKDGKHTIPFEELATARERATQLERENAELAERLKQKETPAAAAETPTTEAPPKAAPTAVDIDALEEQHFEATLEGDKERALDIRRQINAEIERRAAERVMKEAAEEKSATESQNAFQTTVAKALADYPFLDVNAAEKNDAAINDVREWRDYRISQGDAPHEALAKAVAKFGPIYAKESTPPATNQQPSAAEKAAQAIANAKSKPPTTLSDIPAGTAAHHDEAAALLQMSGTDLMTKFAGKTPEQIEALMARTL